MGEQPGHMPLIIWQESLTTQIIITMMIFVTQWSVWQQALSDYKEPAMDSDAREALDAYVAKRKAEIGNDDP